MTDRLITAEEVDAMKPWRDVATGEMYFEFPNGERVFIPRDVFAHVFQRYAEAMAGLFARPGL
jgi:hypothetical protein